jgi:two-component system, chemotaxis family, protein-glutamate methylesterase/glutaminase
MGGSVARRRVVVADDSRLMRRILSDALGRQGFDVVATAADGDEALAEGAFELVAKPAFGEPLETFTSELGRKVGDAAHSGRVRRPAARQIARRREDRPVRATAGSKLVVIACSTGGPKALGELIPRLPSPLGAGTLIVQHMPRGFTASLATRLDAASSLTVREAAGGETLEPGVALLAPGGAHLRLGLDRHARLSDDAPVGGLRPRADLTIEDAAKLYGPRTLLVVLTGMGRDGLEGAKAVRAAGGRILVEAESTCTVYGMPRAVAEAGLADEVLPLDELPAAIAREAGR